MDGIGVMGPGCAILGEELFSVTGVNEAWYMLRIAGRSGTRVEKNR